jgi:DNA-binding Lrp family transcriptional regulator
MSQEELADALGLTAVHVNRTLKALEASGLIEREKRLVTIADWDAMTHAADFNPAYLHLEPPTGPGIRSDAERSAPSEQRTVEQLRTTG